MADLSGLCWSKWRLNVFVDAQRSCAMRWDSLAIICSFSYSNARHADQTVTSSISLNEISCASHISTATQETTCNQCGSNWGLSTTFFR